MLARILFLLTALLSAVAASPAFADPPGRVGRISLISGSVGMRSADDSEPRGAVTNWPVTSGDNVWTGRGARAEIRVGSTALRLDSESEIEITRLDDDALQVRLVVGSMAVRIRHPEPAREFELTTTHGRMLTLEPGSYRFDHAEDLTSASVYQGSLRFEGAGTALNVRAGDRADIWNAGTLTYQIEQPRRDDFYNWSLARDRRDDASGSARYVSPEMTGYEDLDEYGRWDDSADYGPVWYPRSVPAGWAPYRWGHWAWVSPWGWTWIDDSPWGFAPFHYGRWVMVGGLWGWAPGTIVRRPVYAPALVAWVGRPGWSVSIRAGSAPAVGWFPLAPREVYVPAYRCSPAHVRNVNITHVTDVTRITHVVRVTEANRAHEEIRHMHRHRPEAVTVVAADVVQRGSPVRHAAVPVRDMRTINALPVAAAAPSVAAPRHQREHRRPDAEPGHGAPAALSGRSPRGAEPPAAAGGAPGTPHAPWLGRVPHPGAGERRGDATQPMPLPQATMPQSPAAATPAPAPHALPAPAPAPQPGMVRGAPPAAPPATATDRGGSEPSARTGGRPPFSPGSAMPAPSERMPAPQVRPDPRPVQPPQAVREDAPWQRREMRPPSPVERERAPEPRVMREMPREMVAVPRREERPATPPPQFERREARQEQRAAHGGESPVRMQRPEAPPVMRHEPPAPRAEVHRPHRPEVRMEPPQGPRDGGRGPDPRQRGDGDQRRRSPQQ